MRLAPTTITLCAVLAIAGCHSGGGSSTPSATPTPSATATAAVPQGSFIQIERLAHPAVKELFENYNDHDTTNRVNPYGGDTLLASEIQSFTNNFRAPAYGTTLVAVLLPDELSADFSQAGLAAYLGVETGGATGSKFGGRRPQDDAIDISLGAVFGKTLSSLGLVPDDGKSAPCLTTDNVGPSNGAQTSVSFPYLQPPH